MVHQQRKRISMGWVAAITVACLTGITAHAAQPGLYLGGQMGWGNVTNSGISSGEMGEMMIAALGNGNYTVSSFDGDQSGSGFAWRVFGGYQIGYNWAMEIGWTQFPRLPVTATATGTDLNTGNAYSAETSGNLKTYAFDFVGKYIYCLPYHWNVYGKLGLAYLQGRSNQTLNVSEPTLTAGSDGAEVTDRLYPTGGIGLEYDISPQISMDASYARIQKVGGSDQLGSMDLVMLAMALHFG